MAHVNTPRRYTVSDIADALGMKAPAVRRWLRTRIFPGHRGHYWLTHEQFETAKNKITEMRRSTPSGMGNQASD